MNNITGKVVVITDAGSRLGEAAARHLSEQGAIVALGSEKLHHIRELAHELAWNGARVIAVKADLRQKTQVKDLVRQAATAFGTVDVLVTCRDTVHGPDGQACDAAHSQPACRIEQARIPAAIGAVLPLMLSQQRGHIIELLCASETAQLADFGNAPGGGVLFNTLQASNIRTTTISATAPVSPDRIGRGCAASFARALAFAISQPDGMDVNEIVIGASAQHSGSEP
jgi:NADP-dependent 3-hydroxy acid dehydrogenase YdfG